MTETTQNLAMPASKTSDFQPLFENLSHVIEVSRQKFDLQRASNNDKMRWGRLLIEGAKAYASLWESRKIEALEQRLENLEARGDI